MRRVGLFGRHHHRCRAVGVSAIKTIPIALATHMAGGSTTLAHLLRIERKDGTVFAFTSASDDVILAGDTYIAGWGLDITSVVTSAGLAVDNLELTVLDDDTMFLPGEVFSGVWANAGFLISRYNWRNIADGIEAIMAGTLGDISIEETRVVVELRGLQQYLQRTIVDVTSKTCRARLGDAKCRVDLGPYTFSEEVTQLAYPGAGTVPSQQIFLASALTQGEDYFGNGTLLWTSGDNTGREVVVKSFASAVVTLSLPMYFAIQEGDEFTIVAGCRKRHDRTTAKPDGVSDCIDKFNNILNFQGEPHLPGIDAMTKDPV